MAALDPKIEQVLKEVKPPKKPIAEPTLKKDKKAAVKVNQEPSITTSTTNKGNGDWLDFLRSELSSPFMNFFEANAKRCNPRNKSTESAVMAYKIAHKKLYLTSLLADFGVRFIYVMIVIIVGARGLGIIDAIATIFCQK